ncbi:MAG: Protein MraZ [Parcubacteria group bacterium GW2011_GWA1_42_7]|nr:MAG: Protein MraZ [Parcubacteria group bacterium GW2011_GWB1_42_6]KKS70138.1 MAG: Protein MraZ [Parcubacteria group bacterium GW2011_GWA1_42_7]KKS91819.1 MAG: Protein MraZ [Parcubacteria group bacterium GW2011_GWC1_43_12]
MLIGEYKHTIDDKKRLAVPAKLRKELGKGAVLTRGLDNCLALYPLKEWEKLADKLSKLPTGQIEARGLARVILAGAVEVETDALGRILVPDYLKQYAGIEKNAVIAGVFNHLEIWDEAKWESYKQKTEKEVGDMASKLSEIGF